MDLNHKKILKAISLELRHLLEGHYDSSGKWQPGDLEQRLAAIGVRRDRDPVPVDELAHLSDDDKNVRTVVDAYLQLRDEADVSREEAVAEFVRETAYTWANRLLCLRCMEARELIDEVILQKEAYGGRSLEHHRLALREPEACSGEDDGLFAVLNKVFADQTEHLPLLFDPQSPGVALKPSPAVLKRCLALLSGTETIRSQDSATAEVFQAPDALGWAYQYWNTEEKERVFERARTKKIKIAGPDIIPATQLYTEPYMVKFLVQNSLGATWMGMHPNSKLCEKWEYYVRDGNRAPVENKPVAEITFLDPACGSGHFLLEAFDLYYDMYEEEAELTKPEDICRSILERNVFGIDIDARAVQIAEAALWMRAAERAFDFPGAATNLVAAVASHLKGDLWEEFLAGFEREPSVARVLRKFGTAMAHIDELGSLARPEEDLRQIVHEEHVTWERQVREQREANFLFPEMVEDALSGQLPFQQISDDDFAGRLLYRARTAIDAFSMKSREEGLFQDQLLGHETIEGFRLVTLLSRRYNVIAANPPYMGSKNMGPALKAYVQKKYEPGKRDLYAAFIVRSLELLEEHGSAAIVSMNKWLHARAYAPLRCGRSLSAGGEEKGQRSERNILHSNVLSSLADLGSRAFDPENKFHDGVQVVLFVVWRRPPVQDDRVHGIDCREPTGPQAKQEHLLDSVLHKRFDSVAQRRFAGLPGSPLISKLSDTLLDRLKESPILGRIARVRQGICTTNDPRFVRMSWEVRDAERWVAFAKAGGRRRWDGLRYFTVDWQYGGQRIKEFITDTPHAIHWSGRMPDSVYFFKSGWAYSRIAYGSLGLRRFRSSDLFGDTNPLLLFDDSLTEKQVLGYGGLLNTPLTTFLLRAFTQSNDFREGYLRRMPYARPTDEILNIASELATTALRNAGSITVRDPTEFDYDGPVSLTDSIASAATQHTQARLDAELAVCLCEVLLHMLAYEQWKLPAKDREVIDRQMGVLELPDHFLSQVAEQLREAAGKVYDLVDTRRATANELPSEACLMEAAASYLAGEGLSDSEIVSEAAQDEDDEELTSAPLPCVGDVDCFARSASVDVLSAYHALSLAVQDTGAGTNRVGHFAKDLVTHVALRLLGHRWPKQIQIGDPMPEWADPDGIVPLAEGTDESTLLERVRERIAAQVKGVDVTSIEREFGEIMGKSLEKWLTTEFFKHHTKQFKKRPIAWQIQSGKFTGRKKPAFACLVYYQKLDGDLLPKIRNQYVGPLRRRLETELRSIESVSADARSDRQQGRRGELEDQIAELRDFDAALQRVITEGFASKELTKIVKNEPLDKWCSLDGTRPEPESQEALLQQESGYFPDINDGVRVNIAPLQKAGLLAADVLAKKDLDTAIADRAEWRADERRWCREGKLPQPGWWPEKRRETTNT